MPDAPAPAPDGWEELREAMVAAHLASARRRRVNWARQSDAEYDAIAEAVTAHLAARADDLRGMLDDFLNPERADPTLFGLADEIGPDRARAQARGIIAGKILAAVGARVAGLEAQVRDARDWFNETLYEVENHPGMTLPLLVHRMNSLAEALGVKPIALPPDRQAQAEAERAALEPDAKRWRWVIRGITPLYGEDGDVGFIRFLREATDEEIDSNQAGPSTSITEEVDRAMATDPEAPDA